MLASRALPPEILLSVFGAAAEFNPEYINTEALRCAYERNATLAACALVCRAWCSPAQKVLFSDISLGATADPGNEDVDETDGEPRARPGRTGPALSNLISTLETFKDTDNPLRQNIRSLHVCIGHTDVVNYDPELSMDHVVHGSPENVIRAITLCPGLIHLGLTVGVLPDDGSPDMFVVFPESSLTLLATQKPPNLRQLSIDFLQDETFVHANDYYWPTSRAAYQILSVLGPSLTVLDLDIGLDYDGGAEDEEPDGSIPTLSTLHTLHCALSTPEIRSAIYTRAPALRKVVVTTIHGERDLQEFIPEFIENLAVTGLNPDDDLSRFQHLKKLTLGYLTSESSTSTTEGVPLVLQTLPESIEHLRLPAAMATAGHLADVTRKLPHLCSLTLIYQPHVQVVQQAAQQVFHVPVEFSYEPDSRKFFRCSD